MTKNLRDVARRTMLLNAVRVAESKLYRQPMWCFVGTICGVGSTSAKAICCELDWDPDAYVAYNPRSLGERTAGQVAP